MKRLIPLWTIVPERWRSPVLQLAAYGLVGVANTASDFIIFLIAYRAFGAPVLWATTLSVSLASLQSYLVNGLLTFRLSWASLLSWRRAASFAALSLACLLLALLVVWLLKGLIGPVAAKAVSILVNLSFGFWISRTRIYAQRDGALATSTSSELPR